MQELLNRIENAKPLDFGEILSKSFELFKKVWVQALITGLVSILIAIPFILVIYLPFIPYYVAAIADGGNPEFMEDLPVFMLIGWILLMLVISFVLQTFVLSINGHFMHVCKNADLEGRSEGPGYFYLVKKHFTKLLLLSLATLGIALLAVLLCYLPLFYVLVPIQLFLPMIVFNEELSVSDVIKLSFKLGNKFWFVIFGLMFVSGIIASLTGLLLCGIGMIVTSFYQYIVTYYIYKDSIGFEAE